MVAPSISVREGDLIAGKYRVERILGSGGMGVVVAARHEGLDQLVAIKFVRDDVLDNEEAIERFMREARAVVRLKSDHVARVLDVGKLPSGCPFMVMEYLDGMDAQTALTAAGPMPVDLAVTLLLQVCEAVAEAHAAGIVHRDLKPQNLFLTRTVGGSPKMKVLDFGVSKAGRLGGEGALTRTSAMLGSPLYMAPEQMRSSRDVDARVDVWALGVVFFELLTRRNPFEAETMPELCIRVATEAPMPLAALRPDVPPGLVAVVTRCLEKDPKNRFANAAEVAAALEPYAAPPSRLLAERVRATMPGAPPWLAAAVEEPPPRPPRTTSIPAAWQVGGRSPSGRPPEPARKTRAWLVVSPLAATLVVLVFFLAARGSLRGAASSSASAPPSVVPPPNADPSVSASVVLRPPAETSPPELATAVQAELEPAPVVPAARAVAVGAGGTGWPAGTGGNAANPKRAGAAAVRADAGPALVSDDDIPALR
ncbi:MAG TPA: serine/threonine-protein kinase [Polyangiaceae bacterium]|nr:serine/threonine-protein kinase [Polyangiaceae bacterium]